MRHQRLLLLLGFVAASLSMGCRNSDSTAPDTAYSDPTEKLPAKFKTQEPAPKPDFSETAQAPAFQKAIREVSALLGSQPQPLRSPGEGEELAGGVSFEGPAAKVESVLQEAHSKLLAQGFYLFRYEQHFGIGGALDKIGLLPSSDKYEVMAAMETNGDNYNIGTSGVIGWMRELEKDQPFVLTGIGFDFMEGRFVGPVRDTRTLARRMYEFCPDIVDQGVESVDQLAAELEKGAFYFWWD
jgi:hypothetical protein